MKYMLDTNTIINLAKGQNPHLQKKFQENFSKITISCIVLSELIYGNHNADPKRFFENTTNLLKLIAPFDVLPYDEKCAEHYGEIRADLKNRDCLIDGMDLLISAHARAKDLVLVTSNTKHFQRVKGLTIEDWNI